MTGSYAEVEVGYPNQLDPLLMPFRDAPSLIVGAPPVLYVRVSAHTMRVRSGGETRGAATRHLPM